MSQPEQMALVYLSGTNHLLAAVKHSAGAPDLASLVGSDGLHLERVRGRMTPNVAGNGAPTSQQEKFVIPLSQLAQKSLPLNLDVFVAPHAYLVDTSTVAKLPPMGENRFVSVGLNQSAVNIGSTDPVHPDNLSFPVDTRVFIQVEGPDATDRRVMRGVFPKNQQGGFHFPMTVEPDGPLAQIALGKRYFILVMVEGQAPDARTVTL
jgi:hypothetical protein